MGLLASGFRVKGSIGAGSAHAVFMNAFWPSYESPRVKQWGWEGKGGGLPNLCGEGKLFTVRYRSLMPAVLPLLRKDGSCLPAESNAFFKTLSSA